MRNLINYSLALLLLLPFAAQANMSAAQTVVENTSAEVMRLLEENRDSYRADKSLLVRDFNEVLNPVVDFEGFARSVMTVRHSRNASPEQIERFIEAFKSNIAEFYGAALLDFNGGEIVVQPLRPQDQQGPDRTAVHMDILTPGGTSYRASYTMVRVEGEWKVRNVVVEGFNVGLLFRDLFAQAMQERNDNLDAVIADWGQVIESSRDEIAQDDTQ